jgi:peroxiredoxin
VAQLRDNVDKFKEAGAQVVLVGMGAPKETQDFSKDLSCRFP